MSAANIQNHKSFSQRIIISLSFLLGICFPSVAQGPPGYTYCANEGDSFTLPAKCHIAYGAENRFKYLFNQTGTVTFNTETFGGDPIFGTYKSGYYKLATGTESPAILQKAILDIKKHILGTTILTPTAINTIANTIGQNIFVIADNNAVVLDAFDLVDTYEKLLGPIFINAKTKSGFPNEFGAKDGFELVRAVFLIQQGIMDYIYTADNIQKYLPILAGRKFLTSDHFPGVCPAPTDSLLTYEAKI